MAQSSLTVLAFSDGQHHQYLSQTIKGILSVICECGFFLNLILIAKSKIAHKLFF
jgi:hypothetical protein